MAIKNRTEVLISKVNKYTEVNTPELAARFTGTLVLAIMIPIITNLLLTEPMSGINQFFLGTLIFVALADVGVAYDVGKLKKKHDDEMYVDYVRDQFNTSLFNIRKSYDDLIKERRIQNDMYTSYFYRSLQQYEQRIYEAATKQELIVNELHFSTTDLLLGCFSGRDEDVIRLVHFVEENSFMFDVWSRGYYRRIVRLVKDGKIREVRRLFVYKKTDDLSTPETKRLLDFHSRQPGYDYRVVSYGDFMKFCRDLRTNEEGKDFGIYGEWYVYTTHVASADKIEGVYHGSTINVQAYIELFDNCWRHSLTPQKTDKPPMSLYELFEGKEPPEHLTDF